MFERKKIGLALGSGGARGLAHIGVLKVLEEYKIPIDFISGSSMGAVIAALYALDSNAKKLEKEALGAEWKKMFDYTFPKQGFVKGDKIEKFLQDKFCDTEFKDLKIPCFVTAYDIESEEEVIFHKGDIAKAVRASISIPGFFIPVENNGRVLVDGGIIDPIPSEILREQGAEVIIAVNVDKMTGKKPVLDENATKKSGSKKIPNIIETVSKSLKVRGAEESEADLLLGKVDFTIEPNLEKFGTFDFQKSKEIIPIGEKEARKAIEDIKKLTEPSIFKSFLEELEKGFPKLEVGEKKVEPVV